MRILVLTNLYPPIYFGGYELECRDIAEGLRARGHDVTVVTSMCGISSPRIEDHVHRVMRFLPEEIPKEMYADKASHPLRYLRAQGRLASISRYNSGAVEAVLDTTHPDVAFIWNMSDVTLSPLVPITDRRIPRVHRLATIWVGDGLKYHACSNPVTRVVRRVLTGIKNPEYYFKQGFFITPSDFSGRLATEAGIPKENVSTIFCPVHIPENIPPLYDGPVFRMLYAGRVCEEKGVHVAVKAAGQLARDPEAWEFELHIVGSGSENYMERLRQEVADLDIKDRVRFSPAVPRESLEQMRAEYHAFVFTSIWAEPGAMILIETMGYGLPIIASPAGGTVEYLINEENALTFPVGDHKALAAAMKRLMNDRDLQSRLRTGGRRTAEKRFAFEKILDLYEKHLLSAADGLEAASTPEETRLGKS